jgi:ribonuclease III
MGPIPILGGLLQSWNLSVGEARNFRDLEKLLNYTFRSKKLIEQALTHASVRAGRSGQFDNERLEFLGDRVLGLAVAGLLHAMFPKLREGELARRYNRLVSGETCADVARSIDLGRFVILADSEAGSGGRDKDTILADAIEAILGAIFIEAGFEKARDLVVALWQERIANLNRNPVDPKSALQEWSQGNGLALPKYTEVSRSGPDHAPRFVAEVRIGEYAPATADGTSKRQAEQAAARVFLEREGVWKVDGDG